MCVWGGGRSEPSRAPGRLRARSVSATEVEVTWKPLVWSNRRILGYEVSQTPSDPRKQKTMIRFLAQLLIQSDRVVVLLLMNIDRLLSK